MIAKRTITIAQQPVPSNPAHKLSYNVVSAQNTTVPKLDEVLSEAEIRRLIATGYTVNIRQLK